MRWMTFLLLLLPALAGAQPFQQETNTIPVEIYGWQPFAPWTKGYETTAPEFVDIDGDGDQDIFLGHSYWNPPFYRNTGTANTPYFEWETDAYPSLEPAGYNWGSRPRFADIDRDGDFDAFVTAGSNITTYYENIGSAAAEQLILRQDTLRTVTGDPVYGKLADLVDIDSDRDYDYFGGRYWGAINFYRNIGTPDSFAFSLEEWQFEGIDVGDDAAPCFVDLDDDRDYDLLIGNRAGKIWYYENIGDSLSWDFQFISSQYDSLDTQAEATPTAAKIYSEDRFDLFSGKTTPIPPPDPERGVVFYWQNIGTPQVPDFQYVTSEYLTLDEGFYGTGDFADLDADGDTDMFLSGGAGITWYDNVGSTTAPSFRLLQEHYQDLPDGNFNFFDLDQDADLDLSIDQGWFTYAIIEFYRNVGTAQAAEYQYWFDVYWPGPLGNNHAITDIDADGDGDLLFTDGEGDFYFFENTGTPTHPIFTFSTQNFQNLGYTSSYPAFQDWDGDGDFDLFMAGDSGLFSYYENIGTPANPQLQLSTTDYFNGYYGYKVSFADIDADGDPDAFFTGAQGGVSFLRNLQNSSVSPNCKPRPQRVMDGFTLDPNPGNPFTAISFNLTHPQEVSLTVYNLLGAKVATLVSGMQMAGDHTYIWDASGYASGIYLVRLSTAQETVTRKLTIIK